MINTIIFDFAAVMTKENFLPVFLRECTSRFGLDEEKLRQQFIDIEMPFLLGEISCKDFWQIACQGTAVPFDSFAAVFANAYEVNLDMVDLVKKLKKNYLVIMLSDNFDLLAESVKNNELFSGLFERMFFSNEINLAKLTPGCFEYVLEQLGKGADECVFTDDKKENLDPAIALGMSAIQFTDVDKLKKDLETMAVSID